jgi:hypothetical protein
MKEILEKVTKEFQLYNHYTHLTVDALLKQIDPLLKEISRIKYDVIVVELTTYNSIKFKVKISDKILFITQPLEVNHELDEDDIFFSCFINSECIINDVIKINTIVTEYERI